MKINIQFFGQEFPPLYGKSKFYEKKREKAIKKIAKLENIVELCDEIIAKNESK